MPKEKREVAVVKRGLPDSVQLGAMLDEETKRQKVLDKFIQENLKLNIDYGVIPGTQKPTLYKAGAEKVIGLFNIRAEFARDMDTIEMLALPGAVAFKCSLINRQTSEVVGEGRGVAMPKEKSTWNPNTQVKICEKRAMVDAVLQTFSLSSRYTQDMEDMPRQGQTGAKNPATGHTAPYKPSPAMITKQQMEYIGELLKKLKMTLAGLEKQIKKPIQKMTTQEAANITNQLKGLLPKVENNPVIEGEIVNEKPKGTGMYGNEIGDDEIVK